MNETSEIIILYITRDLDKKIRDKAIEEGVSIYDYIKRICIYKPWFDLFEE